jgi:putative flavoprotein involved in K+ transport
MRLLPVEAVESRFGSLIRVSVLDAVVVGAGHAGLAASCRLVQAGLDHVVLERGEVGETWRSQRWDSFALNTGNWMNGLPGSPYAGDAPDGFALMPEWIGYLERYAREHSLPVRTRTAVTEVRSDGEHSFSVSTSVGETLTTRNVIVASGAQNVPKVPAAGREIDRSIHVLTTADYRRPDQLAPGAVLIVGSAQSGCQIAEDLLDASRDVLLATGACGRTPGRMHGRDVLRWLDESGWFDERPSDLPDPAMVRWAQPQISGTGPLGHTVSYQSLAARAVTLLGHFEGASGTRLRFVDDLPDQIRLADRRAAGIRKLVDDHIARSGISAPPSEPDPADEPVADPSRYAGPTEVDVRDRGIGTVIFSTGFTGDFSWLRVPALDARGQPVHTEGRSPVEGVRFSGLPWMRVRKSAIICGASADSGSFARFMRDPRRHLRPSRS